MPGLRRCLMGAVSVFPDQAIATFQNLHANLFPNKQMLTLKIREVRQRLMQNVTQVRDGGR